MQSLKVLVQTAALHRLLSPPNPLLFSLMTERSSNPFPRGLLPPNICRKSLLMLPDQKCDVLIEVE